MLLPGLLCDRTVWQPQIDALAGRADCVVVNYSSLNSLVGMAKQVLACAPTEKFAMAGHSMGGRIAFEVMRLAPERVERVALLDTSYPALAPGAEGEQERSRRMSLLKIAQTKGMRAMGQVWAHGMVHPKWLNTPLFESIVQMIERNTPAMYEAQITALLNRPDATNVLGTIRCPTLVLCGRDDSWSPLARHEEIHAAIAGSRLVVIDECGHMATMEEPGAVSNAFVHWLNAPA